MNEIEQRVRAEHTQLQEDYEVARTLYGDSGEGGPDFHERWAWRIKRAALDEAAVTSEWQHWPER